MVHLICQVIAGVAFAFAAVTSPPRVNLIAVGLLAWFVSTLV